MLFCLRDAFKRKEGIIQEKEEVQIVSWPCYPPPCLPPAHKQGCLAGVWEAPAELLNLS